MQSDTRIARDMPIDLAMRLWPATITVLIGFEMHCVGCALARFHTVGEAAAEHEIDEAMLLKELEKAAALSGPGLLR